MDILSRLRVRLGLDNSEYREGLSDSERRTSRFGETIRQVGGLIAGAFALGAIASFTRETVRLAGEAEGVRRAFERIGGTDQLLNDLTRATRGTVAELELMRNAVQANNFEIPLNTLARLFEFATQRAADTGESVQFLVDSIVTGIGRKSPLILDNLGISASALRDELNGASVAASSIGEVAEAVGNIAQRSLDSIGQTAITTGQGIQGLSAAWDNLRVSIGQSISGGAGLGAFTSALSSLTNGLAAVARNIPVVTVAFSALLAVAGNAVRTGLPNLAKRLLGTAIANENLAAATEANTRAQENSAILENQEIARRRRLTEINAQLLRSEQQFQRTGLRSTRISRQNNALRQEAANIQRQSTQVVNQRRLAGEALSVSERGLADATRQASNAQMTFGNVVRNLAGRIGGFFTSFILPTAIITGIIEGISAFRRWRAEVELFDRILDDFNSTTSVGVDNIRGLTNAINNVNTPTRLRAELIDRFNTEYGQYLDNLLTESSSLDDVSNAADRAAQSLSELEASRFLQRGINALSESNDRLFRSFLQVNNVDDPLNALVLERSLDNLQQSFANNEEAVRGYVNTISSISAGQVGATQAQSDYIEQLRTTNPLIQSAIGLSREYGLNLLDVLQHLVNVADNTQRYNNFLDDLNGLFNTNARLVQEADIRVQQLTSSINDLSNAQDDLSLDESLEIIDAGSIRDLRRRIASVRSELDNLSPDAAGFDEYAAILRNLEGQLRRAQAQVSGTALTLPDFTGVGALQEYTSSLNDYSEALRLAGTVSRTFNDRQGALQIQYDATRQRILALSQDTIANGAEIDRLVEKYNELGNQLSNLSAGFQNLDQLTDTINGAFRNLALGSVEAFGSALGDALTGEESFFQSFSNGILSLIGESMIAVGRQMIVYGGLLELFRNAIASLNPATAIAAGVALVAAGSALRAIAADSMNAGGGRGTSTPTTTIDTRSAASAPAVSGSLQNVTTQTSAQVEVTGEFVLRNKTLAAAVQQGNRDLRR